MNKPINALNWLYHKANNEKDINLIQIYNIVNRHYKFEKLRQLNRFCEISDKIAIHSVRLTDYQRKKHRTQRFDLNGKSYYLFDRLSAWTVGIIPENEHYIYE